MVAKHIRSWQNRITRNQQPTGHAALVAKAAMMIVPLHEHSLVIRRFEFAAIGSHLRLKPLDVAIEVSEHVPRSKRVDPFEVWVESEELFQMIRNPRHRYNLNFFT